MSDRYEQGMKTRREVRGLSMATTLFTFILVAVVLLGARIQEISVGLFKIGAISESATPAQAIAAPINAHSANPRSAQSSSAAATSGSTRAGRAGRSPGAVDASAPNP